MTMIKRFDDDFLYVVCDVCERFANTYSKKMYGLIIPKGFKKVEEKSDNTGLILSIIHKCNKC